MLSLLRHIGWKELQFVISKVVFPVLWPQLFIIYFLSGYILDIVRSYSLHLLEWLLSIWNNVSIMIFNLKDLLFGFYVVSLSFLFLHFLTYSQMTFDSFLFTAFISWAFHCSACFHFCFFHFGHFVWACIIVSVITSFKLLISPVVTSLCKSLVMCYLNSSSFVVCLGFVSASLNHLFKLNNSMISCFWKFI